MQRAAVAPSPLDHNDFCQFRDFIHRRTGIFLGESQNTFLAVRLGRRMTELGLPDYRGYLQRLRSQGGEVELRRLVDEVATHETCFWRHPEQLETFMRCILPAAAARVRERRRVRCRIWSAACSTGEEAFSLAIGLTQSRAGLPDNLAYEILGTDISERAVLQARDGVYGAYSLRHLKAELREQYFVPASSDSYRLKPEIHRKVALQTFNLTETKAYAALGRFDVIFCRNVLIYFDANTRSQVVESCVAALEPGGYFLLAPTESLSVKHPELELVHLSRTIAYRRRDPAAAASSKSGPIRSPSAARRLP